MGEPIKAFKGIPLTLSPNDKWHLRVLLFNTFSEDRVQDSYAICPVIHWYFAEVITECRTRHDVYHLVPKPLHKYVSDFIVNPQSDTPQKAKDLMEKHSEAIDLIHVKLMERLLEE